MTLILFVCRGNTCRSPMAEVSAREMAGRAGLAKSIRFASAGIAIASAGALADPRAIACVARTRLDLTNHRTRSASPTLLLAAARIYVLDRSVRDYLRQSAPEALPRTQLLMSLVPEFGLDDVDDPWSGTAADYDRAFRLINSALAVLIDDLGQQPKG